MWGVFVTKYSMLNNKIVQKMRENLVKAEVIAKS
jgi:hypothetical protein